jgi:hypothetical protein
MTTKVKTIELVTCDRCKNEVNDNHYEYRIGKLKWKKYKKTVIGRLSWMKMRNAGGSQNSWMGLDLCSECTELFIAFMKGS